MKLRATIIKIIELNDPQVPMVQHEVQILTTLGGLNGKHLYLGPQTPMFRHLTQLPASFPAQIHRRGRPPV